MSSWSKEWTATAADTPTKYLNTNITLLNHRSIIHFALLHLINYIHFIFNENKTYIIFFVVVIKFDYKVQTFGGSRELVFIQSVAN